MITGFQFLSMVLILAVTLVGGFFPLVRRTTAQRLGGFPLGQAFAAGVFLALAFAMMLPSGFHLFLKVYPKLTFPVPSFLALASFVTLLAMGHMAEEKGQEEDDSDLSTPGTFPIILTIMIAIPSFLLGAALGVSESLPALMILLAILAHKGTAAFALALAMVRSTLSTPATYALFATFACSTPLGIAVGADIHGHLSSHAMLLVKGTILSLAAGVFVYMATLHDMKRAPLIVQCSTLKGFVAMLFGAGITTMVVLLLDLARSGHAA